MSALRPRIWFERVTAESLPVLHIGNEVIPLEIDDVQHLFHVMSEALSSHHVEIRRRESVHGPGPIA